MKKILSAVIAMLIMIGTAMPVLAAEDSREVDPPKVTGPDP